LSWNLVGTVLRPLKMLLEVPTWWAVSLIGCRKPSAEKRPWCDNQTVAPPRRQQASERRQQGTIGWPEHRPSLLPPKHDELMAQDEQLDVFGEFTAPAPNHQAEQSREGEIGERKEHPRMLASAAPEEPPRSRIRRHAIGRVRPGSGIARA
jgi:hypothetical protein